MKDEYYSSAEARLDTIAGPGHQAYWIMIKSAYQEYRNLVSYEPGEAVLPGFKDYMRDTYGLRMNSDEDGNVLPTYTILDEQKYLIFLLKHSKHEN